MVTTVLVLGSSHVKRLESYIRRNPEYENLGLALTEVNVVFFGLSGGTLQSAHVERYLREVERVKPDVLVVQLAGNDLDSVANTQGSDDCADEAALRLKAVTSAIRNRAGVPVVMICQLMPRFSTRHVPVVRYNGLVRLADQTLKADLRNPEQMWYWKHKGIKNSASSLLQDGVHFNLTTGSYKYFRSIRGAVLVGLKKLRAATGFPQTLKTP